jgi:superfamily II DNA or RNA helicase
MTQSFGRNISSQKAAFLIRFAVKNVLARFTSGKYHLYIRKAIVKQSTTSRSSHAAAGSGSTSTSTSALPSTSSTTPSKVTRYLVYNNRRHVIDSNGYDTGKHKVMRRFRRLESAQMYVILSMCNSQSYNLIRFLPPTQIGDTNLCEVVCINIMHSLFSKRPKTKHTDGPDTLPMIDVESFVPSSQMHRSIRHQNLPAVVYDQIVAVPADLTFIREWTVDTVKAAGLSLEVARFSRNVYPSTYRITAVPTSTPNTLRFSFQLYAISQQLYTASMAGVCGSSRPVAAAFHRAVLQHLEKKDVISEHAYNVMYHETDHTSKSQTKNAVSFEAMVQNMKLSKHKSVDPSLTLVRGATSSSAGAADDNGMYHYPIDLPDCVTVDFLTENQVLTHEFVTRIESSSFMDKFAVTINDLALCDQMHTSTSPDTKDDVVPCLDFVTPYFPEAHIHRIRKESFNAVCDWTGGVIANETGTGKTLSMILACVSGDPFDTSLVVVRDELISQWAGEIRQHTSLRVWEDDSRKSRRSGGRKRARLDAIFPDDYDVIALQYTANVRRHQWDYSEMPRIILVSHTVVRSSPFSRMIKNVVFKRMMVDEAHRIGQTTANMIRSVKRQITWAVTATPYAMFPEVVKLLRLDEFTQSLRNGTGARIPPQFVYGSLTCRTKLDDTRVQIDIQKHYCPVSVEEKSFFDEIAQMMDEAYQSRFRNRTSITRFFRILERLGEGGFVHKQLTLRMLRYVLTGTPEKRAAGGHRIGAAAAAAAAAEAGDGKLAEAKQHAYNDKDDECVVCLCDFDNPVQLQCRHVLCGSCFSSVRSLPESACPQCRTAIRPPFFKPRWPDSSSLEAHAGAPPVPVSISLDDPEEAYGMVLAGSSATNAQDPAHASQFINMQGKLIAINRQLDTWIAEHNDKQLVIFMKANAPSILLADAIRARGLRVLTAGVCDSNRATSVKNIQRFRQGAADVLLVSTKYCEGFDLFSAKEVWFVNTNMSSTKMEQAQGRATRVSQMHGKVTVRVFVYKNFFDELLWDHRKVLSKHMERVTYLHLLYLYVCRTMPNTCAHDIATVLEHIAPGYSGSNFIIPVKSGKNFCFTTHVNITSQYLPRIYMSHSVSVTTRRRATREQLNPEQVKEQQREMKKQQREMDKLQRAFKSQKCNYSKDCGIDVASQSEEAKYCRVVRSGDDSRGRAGVGDVSASAAGGGRVAAAASASPGMRGAKRQSQSRASRMNAIAAASDQARAGRKTTSKPTSVDVLAAGDRANTAASVSVSPSAAAASVSPGMRDAKRRSQSRASRMNEIASMSRCTSSDAANSLRRQPHRGSSKPSITGTRAANRNSQENTMSSKHTPVTLAADTSSAHATSTNKRSRGGGGVAAAPAHRSRDATRATMRTSRRATMSSKHTSVAVAGTSSARRTRRTRRINDADNVAKRSFRSRGSKLLAAAAVAAPAVPEPDVKMKSVNERSHVQHPSKRMRGTKRKRLLETKTECGDSASDSASESDRDSFDNGSNPVESESDLEHDPEYEHIDHEFLNDAIAADVYASARRRYAVAEPGPAPSVVAARISSAPAPSSTVATAAATAEPDVRMESVNQHAHFQYCNKHVRVTKRKPLREKNKRDYEESGESDAAADDDDDSASDHWWSDASYSVNDESDSESDYYDTYGEANVVDELHELRDGTAAATRHRSDCTLSGESDATCDPVYAMIEENGKQIFVLD